MHEINLKELKSESGEIVELDYEGALNYKDSVSVYGSYKLPLKVDLRAKTNDTNIRLRYGSGLLILNWEGSKQTLHLLDILSSASYYF